MTRDIIDLKTLREYLAADLEANFFNRRSCAYRYLKWHRICRYFYLKRGALPKLLLKLANLRRRHYGDRYGFDFKIASPMGKGYHISHNIGVINMARSCGDGLIFRNFVVIGVTNTNEKGPVIGDNVQFGTGCKVIGDVRVGSNVLIGANAVVVCDVPDNSVVAGVPAKIIRKTKDRWGTPMDP
jgi:serine O-acetyltransferase